MPVSYLITYFELLVYVRLASIQQPGRHAVSTVERSSHGPGCWCILAELVGPICYCTNLLTYLLTYLLAYLLTYLLTYLFTITYQNICSQ